MAKESMKVATTRVAVKVAKPRKTAPKSQPRKVAKPALLAGGNPQIAKAAAAPPCRPTSRPCRAGNATWDAASTGSSCTVPGVRKAVKWNSPFYGIEGRGWFLSFHCFTKYIKVAFFRGTSLRPVPPGESKHKEVRYLNIHQNDRFDEALMATWVTQSAALPGWAA
jgi:hypothetical protein